MLKAEGLGVRYGRLIALSDVDLIARPGEILAVIGANGSGKSSLLKALAGFVPSSGSITLEALNGTAPHIGYMPQDIGARAALSVVETVLLGRLKQLHYRVGEADLAAAGSALERLGIAHLATRPLGALSGGQRQLVFLAQVMAGDPRFLFLDEPVSALDIRNQLQVMETVRSLTREHRLTTLTILHDLNLAARFADRIAILKEGRLLACAAPREALLQKNLEQAFSIEAALGEGVEGHMLIEALRPVS